MSVYEASITNPKKQLEFYKDLSEQLQQENKQLQKELEEYKNPIKYFKYANKNVTEENKQLKDNWNELKEWASNFYNSEEVGWAGCGMRYTLEKMQELQGSDNK